MRYRTRNRFPAEPCAANGADGMRGSASLHAPGEQGRRANKSLRPTTGTHKDMFMSASTNLPALLEALRAAGEATRLRLLALLHEGELTVTELTEILGQSQPRVSRHLKLLVESGLVERHKEGAWAFFRLAERGPVAALARSIAERISADDSERAVDRERFAAVRQARADAATAYFSNHAGEWDALRGLHGSETRIERAIVEMVGAGRIHALLDLGTGTGRILELLAPLADRAVGIDASREMLAVARNNLDKAGLRNAQVRQGDVYALPFVSRSFDLVVLHQVLHFLDDGTRALKEAARVLGHGGRMLIVDLAPHEHEFLRVEHAHRKLGFSEETMTNLLGAAGLHLTAARQLQADFGAGLTVSLWMADAAGEAAAAASEAA